MSEKAIGPAGQIIELLNPGEVARIFRVDPKTVTRWAKNGKISSVRTPGGHRRFLRTEVDRLLKAGGWPVESGVLDLPEDTTGYGIGSVLAS